MLKLPLRQSIPRQVWILGIVSLLTDTSTKMIQSLLPLFLVSGLGASLITVGWIEGIAEATASGLKIGSGILSDRWGRRKELAIVGYGLSALVTPMFALASSPIWVFIARFGDRFGKGIRVAPRNALVADVTPSAKRGAAFGLRQSLDTVGAFSGPLIAATLMATSGQNFRLVFGVAIIPALIAVGLMVLGIREPASTASTQSIRWQWNTLLHCGKGYWMLVITAFIFNLGNSSDAFLLLRAQQIGISPSLIPLSLVVMNVVYGCSAYPVGFLSDRTGRVGLLISSFLLYATVYLGFALAEVNWQIWILFGLYGLYLGMSQGVLLALVADRIPSTLRGTAFGLMNLVIGAALLPASVLTASLWQWVSPSAAFGIGSLFATIAALILGIDRLSERQPQ